MALGVAPVQQRFDNPRALLGDRLKGIYRLLADEGHRLFPDDYFADLYTSSRRGRPTVPARVMATVMVLQAHEGLSDREACDRLERDLAWQAAAGVDIGAEAFHPTALVGQRNRLRVSERPRRFLEDTRAVARQAGVLRDRVRVLDSTPIYDAVATQDTVTQLRSAIRRLLRTLEGSTLGARVRLALSRDDDYAAPGKPPCDWDDAEAREALVDALVRDGLAALAALEDRALDGAAAEAAELLAVVAGQDVEVGDDGRFRIARQVGRDRVLSTVDPDARHGHKTRNRRFDGYKGHVSVDPDSEIVEEVAVTPANAPDAEPVADLLGPSADDEDKPTVVGDSAYAGTDTTALLEDAGYEPVTKVPPASAQGGRFTKDDFEVDLDAGVVRCPAGNEAPIRHRALTDDAASFGAACVTCPLRDRCTTSPKGRVITLHRDEVRLQRAKARQRSPEWQAVYQSQRPKVERKIAHLVRVAWGGRKARFRGRERVAAGFEMRAAAVNWARLATLGLSFTDDSWALAT